MVLCDDKSGILNFFQELYVWQLNPLTGWFITMSVWIKTKLAAKGATTEIKYVRSKSAQSDRLYFTNGQDRIVHKG